MLVRLIQAWLGHEDVTYCRPRARQIPKDEGRTVTRYMRLTMAALFALSAHLANAESMDGAADDSVSNYWAEKGEGWFWYKDPPPPPKPKKKIENKASTPTTPAVQPPSSLSEKALQEFQALQKRVEETQKIAIMYPTPENAKAWMAAFQEAKDRSSTFTDVVQRTMWVNPELDYNFRGRPTNPAAMAVFDQEVLKERDGIVRKLAQTHGLFFFFKSSCPYCHAMAPMVRQFQMRYGVNVVPVSLDGGTLPQFPNAIRDNGIAQTLGVTTVPATFMANPREKQIVPIGYGVMNIEEMADRIYQIVAVAPGAQ